MKTQEEIEQLAKKEYNYLTEYEQMHNQKIVVIDAYIDGYTQCQEDMVEKTFTREDMVKAILFGMQKGLNVDKVKETDNDWVNNYIKSLNKQD